MVQRCRYNGAGTEVQVLLLSRRCRGDEEVVQSRCRCRDGAEPMLCGGYAEQVHVMVQSWCRGAEVMVQSRCRAGAEHM